MEHVLIVKAYFKSRKIAKLFMTHVQDSFLNSLSTATFKRKLSSVSLALGETFFLSRSQQCHSSEGSSEHWCHPRKLTDQGPHLCWSTEWWDAGFPMPL